MALLVKVRHMVHAALYTTGAEPGTSSAAMGAGRASEDAAKMLTLPP